MGLLFQEHPPLEDWLPRRSIYSLQNENSGVEHLADDKGRHLMSEAIRQVLSGGGEEEAKGSVLAPWGLSAELGEM